MASDLASALLSGDSAGLSANPALAELLPRMRLAQAMQQEGISTAPAHPVAAAARLVQALVGGQISNDNSTKLQDIFQGNQQQYRDVANTLPGLGGGSSSPAAAPSAPQRPSLAATLAQTPGAATPPSVLGAGGKPVLPDAQGVYGSDAVMMPPDGTPDYGKAIAGIESGGRANPYAVIGPDNGKGNRPIGKYQVMDFNVGPWTKEVLGQEMTPQQFAASPEAQEAVFKAKFDQYKKQTGSAQDAASMWFTGKPLAQGAGRQDTLGTTGQAYVDKFNANLNQPPVQTASAGPAMAFSGQPQLAGGAALPPAITAPPVGGAPQAPQEQPPQATAQPAPQAQQPAAGAVTPEISAFIRQAVASPNPAIRKAGMEMWQTVMTQQLAPPKFEQVGETDMGSKQFGFVHPATQKVTPYSSTGTSGPAFGAGTGGGIESVPAGLRATVTQMIDGRMAPPTGAALRSPQIVKLMAYANNVDPTFDANTWANRNTSVKDFSAGKSSEMVRSANQTIHHVGALVDSMDKLNNGQFPLKNAVGNTINTAMGKGAVTEFMPNAHAVAEELSKVFKGSNLSDAEVRQWEASLSPNMSPEQQRAAVGKIMTLLHGSLSALEEKRLSGMGSVMAERAGPLLKDESQKTMTKISKWMGGNDIAAPAAAKDATPAAALAPGTYTWSPDKGIH